jgi:putative heme-binding domain-containing protein
MRIPLVAMVALCQGLAQTRQNRPRTAEAVSQGAAIFDTKCAGCHGKEGRGGQAPDLYRSRLVIGESDARLLAVIQKGIPGTEMLGFVPDEAQARQVLAYLHSRTRPGAGPPVPGDPARGSRVFEQSGCSRCHIVSGRGGALGPDLGSIALQLPAPRIRESIVDPSARVADRFRTITVTLAGGRTITGALKNEDNFSLQIMQPDGEYALLDRSRVVTEKRETRSLMPADYARKLSASDLQDLLAFLDRQRAPFLRYEATFANH